jgi:[ribosomal protein S5]-alanine N-acetyltransferase
VSPRPIAFPIGGLSDEVVRLRLLADADLPAIVDAVQDAEIPRFTRVPAPYDATDARQFQRAAETGLASGTELVTVIVDAGDQRLLGTVGLHSIDFANRRGSAGYWVAASDRGRGVARRALTLLCRFGFDELGLERIELWIEPANAASLRVAEAVGLQREGLLRSFAEVGGRRRDMLMYSLLPGDLR